MINLITRFVDNRDVIYSSKFNKMTLCYHSGEQLIEFSYDIIYCLCRNYFCGVTNNEKWLLDWNGDRLNDTPLDEIISLGENMCSARIGDSWCLINGYGYFITQDKYKYIGKFKNGYAKISLGNKAGYLTKDGKELFRARVKIIT